MSKINLINQDIQQEEDEDDDLIAFGHAKRIQVFKNNNLDLAIFNENIFNTQNNSNINISQQFNQFYGNQQQQIKKDINFKEKQSVSVQINQQQLSAKRLRAFNAAKYFQKIKISYLIQVFNNIKQIDDLVNNKTEQFFKAGKQFNLFLSILPSDTLTQSIQLKNKNPLTVDDKQILKIIRKIFTSNNLTKYRNTDCMISSKKLTKRQLLFKMGQFLNFKLKHIIFFNIQKFVDQSFYNLDFDQKEKRSKRNKKTTKLEDQIRNKIQRHVYEQQMENAQEFVDLNSFTFESVSQNMSKTEEEVNIERKQNKKRSQKLSQMKKYFGKQTYMIFSYPQNRWKIFLAIDNHFEEIQLDFFKQQILNGLPILSFYSIETLKILPNYEALFDLRKMDKIILTDLSMFFSDNWKKLVARKKRVGVNPFIARIFRFCNFTKPFDVLQPFEAFQLEKISKQIKELLICSQLPQSKIEFNLSEHFLTPSRVGKYHILSEEANPVQTVLIQNIQENQQKIYWKNDLVPVCSRMGWIDFSRMIRQGQKPVKRTQNRNKKTIELYRYEQTKPFELAIDNDGNFILDPEYNSIYVPPQFQIPESTCIITEKVTYICNRHKFKFAKLVQGFVNNGGMRVLPNQIGYIVYKKDKQEIIKLYNERQQLLNRNKQTKYDEKIEKMWKDIIKFVKLVDRMGSELSK